MGKRGGRRDEGREVWGRDEWGEVWGRDEWGEVWGRGKRRMREVRDEGDEWERGAG